MSGAPFVLVAGERGLVVQADNLHVLPALPDASVDLVYIDPPFYTGVTQRRTAMRTERCETGDRIGFQGARYRTHKLGTQSYADSFDDSLGFLAPRLEHAHRVLKPTGSLYFHIEYRALHYCKVLLDQIFGRAGFLR